MLGRVRRGVRVGELCEVAFLGVPRETPKPKQSRATIQVTFDPSAWYYAPHV
jgi:hypothetical protein